MNYPVVMVPDNFPTSFFNFSKEQGRDYLDWFLQKKSERMEILIDILKRENVNLDFSKESLSPLFQWFSENIEKRSRTELEKAEEEAQIQKRFKGIISPNDTTLSQESVSICFDVGIYFGELFVRDLEINWNVRVSSKKYMYYAQPIIFSTGKGPELNPRTIIENVALKVLAGTAREEEFVKLYDTWAKFLR